MFVTIINDCRDQNALGRQASRVASLFNCSVIPIGVENDLEAAGTLVDTLDASEGAKGIVLVNVAPRTDQAKKRENGSPFGYFHWGETLVISSIDGATLSLVEKLGITHSVRLLDIPSILAPLVEKGIISQELESRICTTQFRSFEFLPRVARLLYQGQEFPTVVHALEDEQSPTLAWLIDSFGNVKTTLLSCDAKFTKGERVTTNVGELVFYPYFKDVTDENPALVIGSSGIGDKRFCEIVIKGKSASRELGLEVGSVI